MSTESSGSGQQSGSEIGRPRLLQRVQEADVSTTMIYTHVLNKGGRGVKSSLDSGGGTGQPPVARGGCHSDIWRSGQPPILTLDYRAYCRLILILLLSARSAVQLWF
jgi:hypothetical protein